MENMIENIEHIVNKLLRKEIMEAVEAEELMAAMVDAKIPPSLIGAVLGMLAQREVKASELVGFVRLLLQRATIVKMPDPDLIDIVGSGGDYKNSFNISTASALVVCAAGYKVAKHGNRAVTSKCGSADVLEALGLQLQSSKEKCQAMLQEHGFCFLFAPAYHKSLKNVATIRKELKFRTLFNYLGPLLNPARPKVMLVGVSDFRILEEYGLALKELGCNRGYVFYGLDGSDEISNTTNTLMQDLSVDSVLPFSFDPTEYGFKLYHTRDLRGGDAKDNAQTMVKLLQGKLPGAVTDAVLLNSAFALKAIACKSLVESIKLAKEVIDSGVGYEKLQALQKFSNG